MIVACLVPIIVLIAGLLILWNIRAWSGGLCRQCGAVLYECYPSFGFIRRYVCSERSSYHGSVYVFLPFIDRRPGG